MFDQQGKDPTEGWKMLGGKCVKRMYEKGVKGYVHHIGGPPGLKMQLPADERRGRERPPAFSPAFSRFPRLFAPPGPPVPTPEIAPRIHPDLPRSRSSKPAVGLKQPYLVFQVLLPLGQHVSLEVVVADAEGTRRRLLLSTSFTDVKTSPLHCQVPLPTPLVPTARWLNLVLDLPALVHALFNAEFKSTEGVSVGATCRLRKIFTTRSPPIEHGVDRAVEDEAARIKGGLGIDAGQTGGELGINGFGFGPGDASNGAGSRVDAAYGSAVPEPVPRAADFLPGVDRATLLLDPHKLMACRVALPRAYTGGERGSSREGGAREREAEDLGLGVAGMRIGGSRIGGSPGGSHHFSYSAPTSARKQSSSGGSRGGSRGSDGVRLAFGSRVGPASTPPSRNRSRPTSQPDSAWARSSPTQGGHHSRSRDGTPGGSGTRNERFNEDLASYFAAQGHGRSSGFIDKLSRRNSMDRDLTSGGADGKGGGLPYVDARPKPPPGYASPNRGDRLAGSQADWGDDMAALGDLGASPRSPGRRSLGGSPRSVTFGTSPKTPGHMARRAHVTAQPRAHTVGALGGSNRRMSHAAASPSRSSRDWDRLPGLVSPGGSGRGGCLFPDDDVDLGGSMRVSSVSRSFDRGGGPVVNHFPTRLSRRSSGSGSPNSGSGGDEDEPTVTPRPPPGHAYSSRRYADEYEDSDALPNIDSALGLSNSSLDKFIVAANASGGPGHNNGRNAPPPLVIPGFSNQLEDDDVVTFVEPPERSVKSPCHPNGFGGYYDDTQLAADLDSPSAGLNGRPGRRIYGGRGRGGRGVRGSVERTIRTPSKLHAQTEEGVYMDCEGPGGGGQGENARGDSRAASEVGDEEHPTHDEDADGEHPEPTAQTLEPHRDSNGIAYYPNGSERVHDDDDGLGLSSDDESGQLKMMRESQIIGVSDYAMYSRGGDGSVPPSRGYSRGADSTASGDSGWWSGNSRPNTASSVKRNMGGKGPSIPHGLRLFTPDLILSGGERKSSVPPALAGGMSDFHRGEPLRAVNGEHVVKAEHVKTSSASGGSKPTSPAHVAENTENESESGDLDVIYDPVLNYYFDPKSNKYYELIRD